MTAQPVAARHPIMIETPLQATAVFACSGVVAGPLLGMLATSLINNKYGYSNNKEAF